MKSLSGVGVALSAVFGCLLLALLAELYYLLYCKNKITLHHNKNPTTCLVHDPQLPHPNKPSLSLPSRFLFTITEETREDMESDDGVGRRSDSLGELLQILDKPPFLTPVGSPPYYTPPLTPTLVVHDRKNNNPFLEAERDAEFNRMLRSSPPPKLKFLRDAEDKRRRKMMMGQIEIVCHSPQTQR